MDTPMMTLPTTAATTLRAITLLLLLRALVEPDPPEGSTGEAEGTDEGAGLGTAVGGPVNDPKAAEQAAVSVIDNSAHNSRASVEPQ